MSTSRAPGTSPARASDSTVSSIPTGWHRLASQRGASHQRQPLAEPPQDLE